MRGRLGTLAVAFWSVFLNLALQKGWFDIVPNWAIAILLFVPLAIWASLGLTHDRFRGFLRKTSPLVAVTTFIVVGAFIGGASGGVLYKLLSRSSRTKTVQTEKASLNKADFTATVIRYGCTRETHELFCDVQYVNTGQTRRTVLSVALTTRAKDEKGQHPFINNPLEDSTFGNEPPLYVEPNQPIVKTYRYKLQGEQVGLTKLPGQVFGVLFTIINADGTMNFVTIEAMMVGELAGDFAGTQVLASMSKRDISLDTKGAYIPMDNPFVSPSPIQSPTPQPEWQRFSYEEEQRIIEIFENSPNVPVAISTVSTSTNEFRIGLEFAAWLTEALKKAQVAAKLYPRGNPETLPDGVSIYWKKNTANGDMAGRIKKAVAIKSVICREVPRPVVLDSEINLMVKLHAKPPS